MSFTATSTPDAPSPSLGLSVNAMGTHATGNGNGHHNKLRRRMHIPLSRTTSDANEDWESLQSNRILSDNAAHTEERDIPARKAEQTVSSDDLVDGEVSDANSSTSRDSYVGDFPTRAPKAHPRHSDHSSYASAPEPETSLESRSRAWYEFDFAVVAALVSPVGNWLTGGDHVKNVLLIALLIFYLHQIIEIPWTLYNTSRARRRSPYASLQTPDVLDHHRRLAASELRKLEFLFLTLTVLSPFLGAAVLRYFAEYVSGINAISWFSTALFVLATGVRPWKHIVERLTERTQDLHNAIHYPPRTPADNIQTKMEEMMERVTQFEKSLANMRSKMGKSAEDLYEYVDDAVDAVEKTVRKHERRCEKHEARLRVVEESVEGLRKTSVRVHTNITTRRSLSIIPSWLPFGSTSNTQSPTRFLQKPTVRSHPSSLPAIRLASIPEEGTGPPVSSSVSIYRRIPGLSLALRSRDLATLPFRTAMQYLFSIP